MTEHFPHNDDAFPPEESAAEGLGPLVRYCRDLRKELEDKLPGIQARAWERFHKQQAGESSGTQPYTPDPPRVRPGRWVEAPWQLRPAAGTQGWPDKAGRLQRGDAFPLTGWVQIRHKSNRSELEARSETRQWFLRLFFPRAENSSAGPGEPAGLLELYNNVFFDVCYCRSGGRERRLHLRVTYDSQGDLASGWQEMEPGHEPTECQTWVCFSSGPIDGAEAASQPVGSRTHARESVGGLRCELGRDIDMMWIDFGGEA